MYIGLFLEKKTELMADSVDLLLVETPVFHIWPLLQVIYYVKDRQKTTQPTKEDIPTY
jgi:hypothetical protein